MLVGECKRADPAKARWCFARSPYRWYGDHAAARELTFDQFVLRADKTHHARPRCGYQNGGRYQLGFEFRTGQKGDGEGGSFKIRVPLGRDGTGRRKYRTETLHGTTPTNAGKRCTQLLAQVDSGAYFKPSRMSVKDFIDKEWLPQKERDGVRVASSMKTYAGVARRYITPALGGLQLARVTPRDVQTFYNGMRDAGLHDATMKLARTDFTKDVREGAARHAATALRKL